MPSSYLQ
jgi:ribosomal RNA methyltransferase Nop2